MHVPSRALLRAGLVALVGSILIVLFLVVTRGERARADAAAAARSSSHAAPSAVAPPPAPSAPRVTPAAQAAIAPGTETAAHDAGAPPAAAAAANARVPEDKGDIVPPRSAAGHRVFVDGAQVGEGTRAVRVDCGEHRFRIGSAGREHLLSVPCGQTIELR